MNKETKDILKAVCKVLLLITLLIWFFDMGFYTESKALCDYCVESNFTANFTGEIEGSCVGSAKFCQELPNIYVFSFVNWAWKRKMEKEND